MCVRNSVPCNVEAVFLKMLQKSVESSFYTFYYSFQLKKLPVSMCCVQGKKLFLDMWVLIVGNNEMMTTTWSGVASRIKIVWTSNMMTGSISLASSCTDVASLPLSTNDVSHRHRSLRLCYSSWRRRKRSGWCVASLKISFLCPTTPALSLEPRCVAMATGGVTTVLVHVMVWSSLRAVSYVENVSIQPVISV